MFGAVHNVVRTANLHSSALTNPPRRHFFTLLNVNHNHPLCENLVIKNDFENLRCCQVLLK